MLLHQDASGTPASSILISWWVSVSSSTPSFQL
jgi:hypothetical protein